MSSLQDYRNYMMGFVDSDDVIAPDYFEQLIFTLRAHKVMLAKTKNVMKFYDEDSHRLAFHALGKASRGSCSNAHRNLSYKTDVWRCLFSLELLSQLRFPPIRAGEDVAFGICANALARRVAFTNSARYFYRNRMGSLSRQKYEDTPSKPRSVEDYDFGGFCFVIDFFIKHRLLDTLEIPTDMIVPPMSFIQSDPLYYDALKAAMQSYHFTPNTLKVQRTLRKLLESKNFEEYLKSVMSFRDWRKYNFRLKFNKREKIIRLFGKTLYQGSTSRNKWN